MPSATQLRAQLNAVLTPEKIRLIEEATKAARQLGLPLYLVGGAVRDLLMGAATKDLDLVVEGDSGLLAAGLAQATSGHVVSRSQFGTFKLRAQGQQIDIATARSETYRRPGALPTVRPGSIDDDLERRDFTINAMALRLVPPPLRLLDPRGGQRDIAAKQVRVLHDASFQDDATRMLRAVRYEQRLGFRLEPAMEESLRRDLKMVDTISGDRLRRELDLVLRESRAARMLIRLADLGLLAALYPHLPDTPTLETRLSQLTSMDMAHPHHYLATLAYSLGQGQGEGLVRRLNMPATWAAIVRGVASAREAASSLAEEPSPVTVYRRLSALNVEAIKVVSALTPRESVRRIFQRYLEEWRHVSPLLKGRDLMNLGVPQGPQVGALLEALRDARLEGRVLTRRDEEAFVAARVSFPTSLASKPVRPEPVEGRGRGSTLRLRSGQASSPRTDI